MIRVHFSWWSQSSQIPAVSGKILVLLLSAQLLYSHSYHTHNTSNTRCVGGFTHRTILTLAGCPTVQVNFDSAYWEIASNPKGYGLSPTSDSYFGCHLKIVGPWVTQISIQFGYKSEFPMTKSSNSNNCLESPIELRETGMFTSLLKDMITRYRWIAKWRDTKGKVWESPESRNFCPCAVGVYHPPGTWIYSPTWKLTEPRTIEILWKSFLT